MTTIYEQHDKAFSRVAAYVILNSGEPVAKVSFKYPADGAGRVQCFLHVLGSRMVKGTASGYGYDKASAAFESAVSGLVDIEPEELTNSSFDKKAQRCIDKLRKVATDCGGMRWNDAISKARGYQVFAVIA